MFVHLNLKIMNSVYRSIPLCGTLLRVSSLHRNGNRQVMNEEHVSMIMIRNVVKELSRMTGRMVGHWLRLEKKDDTEVMFCDFCISAGVSTDKTAFISGCSNLRLETIKYHESSNTHLLATNKHANVENPQDAPAYKAKLSLNKAVYAKLSIMFRNVHAINIRARPARDYIWMNQLDECKGLDIGKTYSSNVHKCYEFASAIAEVERNAIKEKLDICKFASVIVDGSMDSSITDNEMVYIQSCHAGTVSTHFIYCCQVQR